MKFYVDYLTGTTRIDKERDFYQTEHLINKISVYVTNCNDSYFLSLEFLLPNGRKATIQTKDAFEDGEPNTYIENGMEYSIHNFSLNELVMSAAGTLSFTCYINFTNPDTGSVIKRGVLFNGVNKIIKTVDYSNSSIIVLDDDQDAGEIVTDMLAEIIRLESLVSSLSPYNKTTLKNIVREIMDELYQDVSEEVM